MLLSHFRLLKQSTIDGRHLNKINLFLTVLKAGCSRPEWQHGQVPLPGCRQSTSQGVLVRQRAQRESKLPPDLKGH